jgi:molecular chaperone GrpE
MSNTEKEIQEENINAKVDATNEEITNEETATAEQENTELTTEEKLQKELDEANEKVAALEDKYLRQVAEFDNYRKRTIKEKAELIKNGSERAIESILPVLDDFERALSNMAKDENASEIMTGVELIYNKFVGILKQNGLQKIETEGADFNTDYHEAIALIPTPDEKMKGKVLERSAPSWNHTDGVEALMYFLSPTTLVRKTEVTLKSRASCSGLARSSFTDSSTTFDER